jgi:hypothetical protein
MFYRIENGKIKDCAAGKYDNDCIECDIAYSDYINDPERYEVKDGVIMDISEDYEYIHAQEEKSRIRRISEIKEALANLDLKSIRCVRVIAGGVLGAEDLTREKNLLEELETQICNLRDELSELNN